MRGWRPSPEQTALINRIVALPEIKSVDEMLREMREVSAWYVGRLGITCAELPGLVPDRYQPRHRSDMQRWSFIVGARWHALGTTEALEWGGRATRIERAMIADGGRVAMVGA